MEIHNNHLLIEDVRWDYPELLKMLRDHGEETSPRGQPTREIIDVVMKLDPHSAIVHGINRRLSMKLISMESLTLITGTSYPQRLIKAAPNMARYLDGEVFHGHYGVRIGAQLAGVINRLKADKDTRQALITIWDPILDLFNGVQPKDVPCTTILQFLIRKDQLVLHVTMRSNDVWWGTPHDWGQFSQLQLAIANVLGIEAGPYYHHAVSFHLYEKDFDKIDLLTQPIQVLERHDGLGWENISLEDLKTVAETLIECPIVVSPNGFTEEWHKKQQIAIDVMDERSDATHILG
jgi:thymidylate synthase